MDTAPSHILVVDDDAGVRSLVTEYLSQNDFRVTAVSTGKEMMAVLASEAIDLIVLDLKLPGEDGLTLARKLRETSNISIIMVTGWGQRLVASGEVPAHVVAVLSKPPNLTHLRHRLAECVGERTEQGRA